MMMLQRGMCVLVLHSYSLIVKSVGVEKLRFISICCRILLPDQVCVKVRRSLVSDRVHNTQRTILL